MTLVYIGRHFYHESGTSMGCLYTEDGFRSDWGKVELAVESGETVTIRPATVQEDDHYESVLAKLKRERAK